MTQSDNTSQAAPDAAIAEAPSTSPGYFRRIATRGWMKWVQKIGAAIFDQGLFAGSNFVLNVLLARWMFTEHYGAFVVAYSLFLLAQNFYEAVLIEPMTIYGSGKYTRKFKKYLAYMYIGHGGLSLLLAVVLMIGAGFLYIFDSQLLAMTMVGIAVASPFILTRWLTRQPFYVMSAPIWSGIGGAIYFVVTLAIFFLLHGLDNSVQVAGLCAPPHLFDGCFMSDFQSVYLTPFTAPLAMGIGGIVASICLTVFLLKPNWHLKDEHMNARDVLKDHWQYGKWSTGTRLLNWIPSNIYYLVLPFLVTLGASGELRALLNLVMPMFMAMSAITAILLPNFVRTYRNHGKSGLSRRVRYVMMGALAFTGGYFVFLALFGKPVISWLYDGKIDDAATMPIILTMGLLPVAASANIVLDAALRAIGGVKQSFLVKIIPITLLVTVGIGLLAAFGLLGANLGTLLMHLTTLALLTRFYLRFEGETIETVGDDDNGNVPAADRT